LCTIREVFTPGIIQGRHIGEKAIEQVRGLNAGHPEWPRGRISEQLARLCCYLSTRRACGYRRAGGEAFFRYAAGRWGDA